MSNVSAVFSPLTDTGACLFVWDEKRDVWVRLKKSDVGSPALLPRLGALWKGRFYEEPVGAVEWPEEMP